MHSKEIKMPTCIKHDWGEHMVKSSLALLRAVSQYLDSGLTSASSSTLVPVCILGSSWVLPHGKPKRVLESWHSHGACRQWMKDLFLCVFQIKMKMNK